MNKDPRELGLTKLSAIEPRQPKELIEGMFNTGTINLIGYYKGMDITALISALTASVTNGTLFAGKPAASNGTVILLSKREPISFVAQVMQDNEANMDCVIIPDPAEHYMLNVEYIKAILESIDDPSVLIIHSLEDVVFDKPPMLGKDAYRILQEINEVCTDHDCALIVTSEIIDADDFGDDYDDDYEDDDDDEEESAEDYEELLHQVPEYDIPMDIYGLRDFLESFCIMGRIMPDNMYCFLRQPTTKCGAKLYGKFDIDENRRVIWKENQ